ncbi:hypothetical protein Daus18300_000172 [Diaporthe australafricana]|uniref:LPXTG-domain-containing protein n=1 Tax=Diaporthe australafricana TaxID=127596 RepID=A0ABR3Y6Y9_9PEZI
MSATITAPLAPLTTIFTPPCSISWLLTSSRNPSQFPPFPTAGPASCNPPSWAANIADKGFQYYSPAICPSGFEVGPGCQIKDTRTAEGFPAVEPDETAAYCVPSGFTCTTDTTDFRGGVWGATRAGAPPLFTVGPALQIRFQESDLSILETHPLTPGLTLAGLPSQASVAASASATAGPGDSTVVTATFGQFTTIPTPTPPLVTEGTPLSPAVTETTLSRAGPSTAPANMTSPLNQTDPATIPSNEKTAGSKGQNSTSIAAIVLSTLLSIFAVAFTVYVCLKGRRRRFKFWTVSTKRFKSWTVSITSRRRKGLLPVGVGVWIGTRGSDESDEEVAYEQAVNSTQFSTSQAPRLSLPQAPRLSLPRAIRASTPRAPSPPEMDESGIRIPIFGQQRQDQQRPRLKVPATAELDDSQDNNTPSRHGSWVSRVSRMLSRAARSSTTSRSSSRSRSRPSTRWATTTRRPASAGEWERSFQGSRGAGGGLTVPNVTYTRPSSTASSLSSSSGYPDDPKDDFFDLEGGAARRLPKKVGSFDRLSDGTFGLRGRSRDRASGAKRKS